MSGFYCDVKPNICMKKDQKAVQRPVPDAYEFSPIPDSLHFEELLMHVVEREEVIGTRDANAPWVWHRGLATELG